MSVRAVTIVSIIKRFSAFDGKSINRQRLKNAIVSLQKEAKKGDFSGKPHVSVLRKIQTEAIEAYNLMLQLEGGSIQIRFSPELKEGITKALEKKTSTVKKITRTTKKRTTQKSSNQELGKVKTFKPENTTRIKRKPNTELQNKNVITAKELSQMKFTLLDFSGRWLEFIGKPSVGFYMMLYSKPKHGKSYLSFQLARYMLNFGSVLYCLAEEGFGYTAQKKMMECGINPSSTKMHFSKARTLEALQHDINLKKGGYGTIVIDSVTKFHCKPEEFDAFRMSLKPTNVIAIFQVTKGGVFKGAQDWEHDVDVVANVPEIGQATQYGRFGTGEFDIFQDVKPIEE